jgi:prepilin-type N-terminal cleavage/methylation domain-containing protein
MQISSATLKSKSTNKGMSLLEILVVVAIFAVLGIITSRAIILTIGGSKKSESLVKVRENLNYTLGILERQIRNANTVTECPNSDINLINYTDQNGTPATLSCVNVGTIDGYVASASARLTSGEINITNCAFVCQAGDSTNPPSITITLEAQSKNSSGVQGTKVTSTTQVFLRNY